MKKGVPGVYTRRLSVTSTDIQMHRRLLNYLLLYYRRHKKSLSFSPLTCGILEAVPHLSFVPCFILARFLIRINEITQITVPDLKSLKPILIKSSKSDHVRSVVPLESYKLPLLNSINNDTQLMVISYDSLKSSIASARNRLNIDLGDTALDSTHIFRHLEASFMYKSDIPISAISECLGHKMEKTTLQYIHKEL